ncbi:uncharacterized protein EDB91DRAFT_1347133 [Suillus paluster]|uniref:uncharacterized protein n=1 Tax=Suillus paluster TaxID=48578 RepID=UPI001B85F068|nr:uncharacterized protein EDB91DRAFT_1347133 [Suillus paluster]KAG1740176.1 hypothetical protein EDB91DRAFT_1347133 [Suillus paluster]
MSSCDSFDTVKSSLAEKKELFENREKEMNVGTLAVPLLETPSQSEGATSTAQFTRNSSAPLTLSSYMSMPEPNMPTTPPYAAAASIQTAVVVTARPDPAATGHFFDLIPIIPRQIKRYGRKDPQGEYAVYEVPKGPLDCSEELVPVLGWEPLTHPEGALFFYHSDCRVFTDVDVREPGIAVKMSIAIQQVYEEAHKADTFHPSVELALERMEVDGKEKWGYYFADHNRCVIFWLEPHPSKELMSNVRGVKRKNHVRYALESQYWFVSPQKRHIELFPNKRLLPKDVVVRLKEIVMFTQADSITSEKCLTPFSSDQVASILGLMNPLMSSIDKEHEHSVWIVARFMGQFCRDKFVNFCGQPGARLDANQSLYGDPDTRPKNFPFRVMNIILFGSPDAHSKAIHNIWVDYTIVQRRWKNFITGLNSEWNGYTIFSTVMLAVDISFLAVPSVQNQAPAILVSYLSTLCAMGSLVISLVLAGQVNDGRRDSAKSVVSFLFSYLTCVLYVHQTSFMVGMSRSMLGLESLALMLSLPHALLIWGMAFFAVALLIMIVRTSGAVTISIVSPMWAAMVILAGWPVLTANGFHISHLRSWVTRHMSHSRSLEGAATSSHA